MNGFRRTLPSDELQAGRPQVIGDRELVSGRGYYLAYPENRKLSPAAQALRRHLLGSRQPALPGWQIPRDFGG